MAELASIKLIRIVSLQEEEHQIHLPPESEKKLNNENLVSKLETMKESIINHKELQCELGSQRQRQAKSLKELLDSKVNQRTSNCTSYRDSLFKVLYPKGINPRKK